jgi:hypothetical protein
MKPNKRRYPLKEICENDQSQCESKNLKKQFVFENQKVENSVDETKNMKSSLMILDFPKYSGERNMTLILKFL